MTMVMERNGSVGGATVFTVHSPSHSAFPPLVPPQRPPSPPPAHLPHIKGAFQYGAVFVLGGANKQLQKTFFFLSISPFYSVFHHHP